MLTLNPTLPDLLLGTAVDRSGSFLHLFVAYSTSIHHPLCTGLSAHGIGPIQREEMFLLLISMRYNQNRTPYRSK
jgi:hypothetical protein